MQAPEIKIATLKSKATRNFNKSAANQKDPGPGDIVMPMMIKKDQMSHYVDDLGAPIKCIVTHSYKNYIFGTIINTIPTMKMPKEVCLSDAVEADAWEYDFEICTRAIIEETSALTLALEEIKYRHKKVKEWKAYLNTIARVFPDNIEAYETVVKNGYIGLWPSHISPNRSVKYHTWQLNSFLQSSGFKIEEINIPLVKDRYRTNFRHQIGEKVLFMPNQIISFQDWLIQNP